mgnify:FL=1
MECDQRLSDFYLVNAYALAVPREYLSLTCSWLDPWLFMVNVMQSSFLLAILKFL